MIKVADKMCDNQSQVGHKSDFLDHWKLLHIASQGRHHWCIDYQISNQRHFTRIWTPHEATWNSSWPQQHHHRKPVPCCDVVTIILPPGPPLIGQLLLSQALIGQDWGSWQKTGSLGSSQAWPALLIIVCSNQSQQTFVFMGSWLL